MKTEVNVMSGKECSERSVKACELVAKPLNNLVYETARLSKGETVDLVIAEGEAHGK